MKRTFQPSNISRKRTHGFLVRMATKNGRLVIKRRRAKGRKRLSVSIASKQFLFRMPTFDKSGRLRKRIDFTVVAARGRKLFLPDFIIIKSASERSWPRIGITVSRKVGNAVCRNRIKRLIREFFRNNRKYFQSADYNIIARSGAAKLGFDDVCQELANGLCRFGQQNSH